MIENKLNLAEAMQMSLLDAQKKNIEADTKLKEADANKTSGVDTEKAGAEIKILEATVDKIGEEIKNFGVQRELISLEMSVKRGEIDKIAQEIQISCSKLCIGFRCLLLSETMTTVRFLE